MAPSVTVSALHGKLDSAAFDAFFEHCILRKFFPGAVPAASTWLHAGPSPAAPSSGQSLNISLRRCGPPGVHLASMAKCRYRRSHGLSGFDVLCTLPGDLDARVSRAVLRRCIHLVSFDSPEPSCLPCMPTWT